MKKILMVALLLLTLCAVVAAQDPQQAIRDKTLKFTSSIVAKNLNVLDEVFDKDPGNIYYDINEGPLVGFDRLKRVWTAATTNFTISKFDFNKDMKIWVMGDQALQVGTWTQTQVNKEGASRDIVGRATILWHKKDGQWWVWHYHASITPPRPQRPPR
ncbi:MAG: nuclear transport factor 2 family protein [Acidobacteriia bacterium]|nr:nuclear transport factor 2 family protein [Terriglobia bacterium]